MTEHTATRARLIEPRDALELCERLHDVAARMTDLLAQETALLQANQPHEIGSLQSEKSALSKAYARDFTLLKANAPFVNANAETQTDRLRRALKVLHREVERNFNALEAARAVSEGLMNAIFEIARAGKAGPKCYTKSADMAQHRQAPPTALAVDRSL